MFISDIRLRHPRSERTLISNLRLELQVILEDLPAIFPSIRDISLGYGRLSGISKMDRSRRSQVYMPGDGVTTSSSKNMKCVMLLYSPEFRLEIPERGRGKQQQDSPCAQSETGILHWHGRPKLYRRIRGMYARGMSQMSIHIPAVGVFLGYPRLR